MMNTPKYVHTYHVSVDYTAVAHHEAAHAVVATVTGAGHVYAVQLAPMFGIHGLALIDTVERDNEPLLADSEEGRAFLSARLTGIMAGPVAERILGTSPEGYAEWYESELEERGLDDLYEGFDGHLNDDLDDESDFAVAFRLALLCGVDPEAGWVQAECLLREPAVWRTVEAVADLLLARKSAGLASSVNIDEFHAIMGNVDLQRTYRTTTWERAEELITINPKRQWWQ